MKKLLTAIAAAALLAGCATDKERATRVTQVISVPEGAQIVINGMNVGRAPLSVESESNEFGSFVRQTTFTAIPQEASMHTQVISFPRYEPGNSDRSSIPEKITFNMYKNPAEEGGAQKE